MKAFILILGVVGITLSDFYDGIGAEKKKTANKENHSVKSIKAEKNFVPYSWQVPWFKKDLNSRSQLGNKGC